MPEPNRSPWRVAADIDNVPVCQLVECRMSVVLDCESCPHLATWTPAPGAKEIRTHSDRQWLQRSRDPSQLKVLSVCPPKRRPISGEQAQRRFLRLLAAPQGGVMHHALTKCELLRMMHAALLVAHHVLFHCPQ